MILLYVAAGLTTDHTLTGTENEATGRYKISGVDTLLKGCRVVTMTEEDAYRVVETGDLSQVSEANERKALMMLSHGIPSGRHHSLHTHF